MATEHIIDLAAGTDELREVPDCELPQPDPAVAAELRKKERALTRLRAAALENGDLRDILTLLGY